MKQCINKKTVIVFITVFCIGFYFFARSNYSSIEVLISDVKFNLEIADTEDEYARGLSNREELCQKCGMIFVFSSDDKHAFWMKDTDISLDILWLQENKIVFISKETKPLSLELLAPDKKANTVIEVNAGIIDRLDIKIGDYIEFI